MKTIQLSPAAEALLQRLEDGGFEAYAVGGGVRDSLMGREVHDWDLCSSATPQEVTQLLCDLRVLPTGIDHGTVTVLMDAEPLEVTMFRGESDYDGRKPHTVRPVRTVTEDLQRRDFTVNAMAYSPKRGLLDPYGAQQDLSDGILRAVGEPLLRFNEDYLRILRALRFAATYGFTIEKNTASAMEACSPGLKILSAERVWNELSRLLCGKYAGSVLTRWGELLHGLDGGWKDFRFSAADGQLLDAAPQQLCGRLAIFLHKLPQKAALLESLRCPTELKQRVSRIWERAETLPSCGSRKALCAWLHGFERAFREEDRAFAQLLSGVEKSRELQEILDSKTPLDLCDLEISGADLLAAGVPAGPLIGKTLEAVLMMEWESAESTEWTI